MGRLRIGIPNRSSLLHVAGTATLINCGLLKRDGYHAAKLHYRLATVDVYLCRISQLCNMFGACRLDIILAGDDYMAEAQLSANCTFEFPVMQTRFAFLSRGDLPRPSDRVLIYTKFPRLAKQYAKARWSDYEILTVDGSSETYCFLHKSACAFDVVCTGGTAQENGLQATIVSAHMGACWLSSSPSNFEILALPDASLIDRVRKYYDSHLATRDMHLAKALDAVACTI